MPAEILVLFGSDSDSGIFEPLMKVLKEKGLIAELRICSAHRTAKMLEEIISGTEAKVIIAGAGLSAALPGVIASQTLKPVIGIPAANNYSGLDALLSVHQLPPGIPVLGVGVDAWESAIKAVESALIEHSSVKIIKNFQSEKLDKKFEKLPALLTEFEVKFEIAKEQGELKDSEIVINFIDLNSEQEPIESALAVNVPLLESNSAADTQKLLEKTKKGLWVGLNRFENAGIAATELLAVHDSQYAEKLSAYRKKTSEKVVKADAECASKFK